MDNMKSATIAQEPLSEKYPWITEDMLKEMWKLWVGNEGWNSLCVKFFEYILDQQPKQEQENTLEQIEEAMLRAHCHGYMIRDALEYLAPKPKPKTPECLLAEKIVKQLTCIDLTNESYRAAALQDITCMIAALKEDQQ